MLGLLVLVTIAHTMQPQAIPMGFRSLFSVADRNSMFIDTALDKRAQAIMLFFAICMLSMAAYVSTIAYTDTHRYDFDTFALIVLLTTAFLLLRSICKAFVAFVFVPRAGIDAFIDHYYHLAVCTALVHYPLLLLCLFWSALTPTAIILTNATLIGLFLIILIVKSSLLLVRSFRGFLYVLIYIFTFEVLPLGALLAVTFFLITN